MSFKSEHELHGRRKGLNIGVGLMLGSFVLLIMLLTFTKITSPEFAIPASEAKGVGAQISVGSGD